MNNKDIQDVSETVAKNERKKRNAPARPNQQPKTNPGDNAKYIRHSLTLAKLPKVDLSDNVAVENRVFEYFTICEDNDMKPSVVGLAVALGCSRDYPVYFSSYQNISDKRFKMIWAAGKVNLLAGASGQKKNYECIYTNQAR